MPPDEQSRLRVLMFQGKLKLFVPAVVLDEFQRNRPRAEAAVTDSVLQRFRMLRQDLHDFSAEDGEAWLEEMARKVPMVSSATLQNFSEIAELLGTGSPLEPSDKELEAVVRRGLQKSAPFHLNRNSVADALLIELYASAVKGGDAATDQYAFATSNHLDFSTPNGDHRLPHPDLASLFDGVLSHYVYGVDGLRVLLDAQFGDEYRDLVEETRIVHDEPRTLAEILEAEREFFDKIWYVRKLILEEKIEAGEHGRDAVGPWDDWGWGFVHGKLSALRWVLGSEWDFLDT
jgi:hypothetical protein